MGIVEDIIKEKYLTKTSELDTLVQSILKNNKQIVAQYLTGKEKALNVLVGMVMKQAKSRADANDVISLLKENIFSYV